MDKLPENAENHQDKKNWSDLPMELKEKIIKNVDFQSSLRLRQTARLERFLVDSRKFKFCEIELHTVSSGWGSLEIWNPRKNGRRELVFRCEKNWCMRDLPSLMAHILKIGNIDELEIDSCGTFMKAFLKKTDSIRIQKLKIVNSFSVDLTVLLLNKCPEILDSVEIHHRRDYIRSLAFRAAYLAKISNTKILYYRLIDDRFSRQRFSKIVMALADRQNTVGRTVVLRIAAGGAIVGTPPNLRTIQSGDRLPTDDPNIEIIFKVGRIKEKMQDVKMDFVSKINDSQI